MYYYIYFFPILLVCFLLSAWASFRVNSAFKKYSKVQNRSGMTGYDTATRLLQRNGIRDVQVGRVSGSLSDHYNPAKGIVNLSETTYGYASVGSVAVAAHEIGHVVQKQKGYLFYKIRTALVPVTNLGSRLAMPLVLVGMFLDLLGNYSFGQYFVYGGIVLYGLSTLFMLVTLPVEYDASRRANEMLVSEGILTREEAKGAKKVLSAAALTYVASLMTSLVYFLRFLFIVLSVTGRRRK
ncbi:MAG: zinc metallopeptidase [Clostridia bacterium]|nr:zinc metallopeptidase [Clostridia bacterium]